MQISLRQEWKLAHMMALALIFMGAFFVVLLYLPHLFSEDILYYFVIVPYVSTILPFESVVQDPHALPVFSGLPVLLALMVIYGFFLAIVAVFFSKMKVIPIAYVGLYIVLSFVFDKLFGHLF